MDRDVAARLRGLVGAVQSARERRAAAIRADMHSDTPTAELEYARAAVRYAKMRLADYVTDNPRILALVEAGQAYADSHPATDVAGYDRAHEALCDAANALQTIEAAADALHGDST